MITTITRYGLAAGFIIGSILFGTTVGFHDDIPNPVVGMAIGYAGMLLAFSMIVIAIRRHRDGVLGGVIGFWPALGLGLGISLIATVFYVLAWEAALAVTGMDFGAEYAGMMVAEAAKSGDAAAIAKAKAAAAQFAHDYAQPLWRMGVTATEILPVGLLVSLVAAGWLSRRRTATA
ncbi:DUF4199 domain-containing protein [Sandarakinorhabdus sp.]|uniref:DUF4199 domain-containing protein n=1 Tax=Sandarakinorhabdus sp. TaxID=1916663 RepID=UPI00286DD409|nr:DUF4199 domain-containing protein [Sandarakinorhabdus sp.]